MKTNIINKNWTPILIKVPSFPRGRSTYSTFTLWINKKTSETKRKSYASLIRKRIVEKAENKSYIRLTETIIKDAIQGLDVVYLGIPVNLKMY